MHTYSINSDERKTVIGIHGFLSIALILIIKNNVRLPHWVPVPSVFAVFEFFNRELYKEMKGVPIAIFPALPANIKRKELYQKLSSVKEIRNQLVHSRILPITQSEQLNTIETLIQANDDLISLLQWLGFSKPQLSSKEFEKGVTAIKKALK